MNKDSFCYGSEDPQVCLNCKRSRCVLDSTKLYKQQLDPKTNKLVTTAPPPLEFAAKLRQEMERNGLTSYAVSKKALVSMKTVKHWTEGITTPQPAKIKLLTEIMPNLVEVE